MEQLIKISLLAFALIGAPASYATSMSNSLLAEANTHNSDIMGTQNPELSIVQSNGMSLNQAVEQVRRQYKGRIVSAETKRNGNREVHHIKVLTEDGKVKTVKVPGRTLKSGG